MANRVFRGNQYVKLYNQISEKELCEKIQKLYDEEFGGWKKIAKEVKTSCAKIQKLLKEGKINFYRTKSEMLSIQAKKRRHSEETKQKISKIRKAYLREHPEMVPYKLNHYSKGESYPEQYFRKWLEKEGIAFEQEKQISIYSLDFLINNNNLEIDGDQHYLDERIVKSNQKRDAYMLEQGIKTIRVRWSSYQSLSRKEREDFLSNLKKDICG